MVNHANSPFFTWWISSLFLLTGLVGCGDSGAFEELVPVGGTVTFDGEPAAGAVVMFIPDGKNVTAHSGSAVADSDGQFEMLNFRQKKGLPVGDYIVTVSWKPIPDGGATGSDGENAPVVRPEKIPPQWNVMTKAGQHNKVKVPEEGKTDFDFKIPKVMSDSPGSPDSARLFQARPNIPGNRAKPPGR